MVNRQQWESQWSELRAMWKAASKCRNMKASAEIRKMCCRDFDDRVYLCFVNRELSPVSYSDIRLSINRESIKRAVKHNMALPKSYRRVYV